MTQSEILRSVYQEAVAASGAENRSGLSCDLTRKRLDEILSHAEGNKAVVTVLVTLMTQKIFDPAQDIRCHQEQIPGGFSGRTIDTKIVTPFMKQQDFPAMAESGWLTRSLEQALPYDLNYPGKIRGVKDAFLGIVDSVERNAVSAHDVLKEIFTGLIRQREALKISLAKPQGLSISRIVELLERHFTMPYNVAGAARLPVLAIQAVYSCLMGCERYKGKSLLDLEAHSTADRRTGRIGDIEVVDGDGRPFEGVEVKHEIKIMRSHVIEARKKFISTRVQRYYLLTTANMDSADWDSINHEIDATASIHGCQVIVNGVYSSLKYYLRILDNPADFVERYVDLMQRDSAIKYPHKAGWNALVSENRSEGGQGL